MFLVLVRAFESRRSHQVIDQTLPPVSKMGRIKIGDKMHDGDERSR